MTSPTTAMSEPNAAPVLPSLSLDIPVPADSDNGSTAQPTPTNAPVPLPPTMPQISIVFLVISGGRRTMSFEPSSSVGRVKELVWLSWPSEWSDERPPAPSYLRILYLGRLLQDDDVLESIHNPLCPSAAMSPVSPSPSQSAPMIMHLSIRPTLPAGEGDDLKKKRKRIGRNASTSSATPGATDQDNEGTSCCTGCVVC